MAGSYKKINYGLRPTKSIERKMLVEAFRKLSEFSTLESYRYIGFGSTYFSDFALFHKSLGIKNMISIEQDVHNQERFRFNCPFKCIDIRFGPSNEILPLLEWDLKTILWLDYDGQLNRHVLEDVSFFTASAVPGSIIIVSVNAQPENLPPDQISQTETYTSQLHDYRLERLKSRVGEEKIPTNISRNDLNGWNNARLYQRIITNQIQETLLARNGSRNRDNEILYKQTFNFHYADGAKMLTVGGLLYERGQTHIVAKCAFEDLIFAKIDETPYLIEVPNLTYRELRFLDKLLPIETEKDLEASPIPKEDVKKYASIYRYFPTFAETEL